MKRYGIDQSQANDCTRGGFRTITIGINKDVALHRLNYYPQLRSKRLYDSRLYSSAASAARSGGCRARPPR